MIIITRKKARTCTDRELHSALAKLYNFLANQTLDEKNKREAHASIKAIKNELGVRSPR